MCWGLKSPSFHIWGLSLYSDVTEQFLYSYLTFSLLLSLLLFQGRGGWGGLPRWQDLHIPSTVFTSIILIVSCILKHSLKYFSCLLTLCYCFLVCTSGAGVQDGEVVQRVHQQQSWHQVSYLDVLSIILEILDILVWEVTAGKCVRCFSVFIL